MNIILTNQTSGKVLINSDQVRMYVPTYGNKTTVYFNSGERIDVSESIAEIEAILQKNNLTGLKNGKS